MMADSVGELNAMAKAIGLKIRRYRGLYPSYELRPSKRIVAIKKGAVKSSTGRMISIAISNTRPLAQTKDFEGIRTAISREKCHFHFYVVKTNCGEIV